MLVIVYEQNEKFYMTRRVKTAAGQHVIAASSDMNELQKQCMPYMSMTEFQQLKRDMLKNPDEVLYKNKSFDRFQEEEFLVEERTEY